MENHKKWETVSQEYVINSPFIKLRKDVCITDEQDIIDDYYVCEFPNWVNVVAVTPQNEVILVREYRYPIGEYAIAIPAGKVEDGETESDAAARELKEETGFCTKDDFIFLGSFYTNAANATNKVFTYLATNVSQVTNPEKTVGEKTEVEKMTWEEIENAIKTGTINQVFSVLALKLAEEWIEKVNKNAVVKRV